MKVVRNTCIAEREQRALMRPIEQSCVIGLIGPRKCLQHLAWVLSFRRYTC